MVQRGLRDRQRSRWIIRQGAEATLLEQMRALGLSTTLLEAIRQPENRELAGDLLVLYPPLAELAGIDPATRAKLYEWLKEYPENSDILHPNCLGRDDRDLAERVARAKLRPEMADLIRRLCYRRGAAWVFSDSPAVVAAAKDAEEAYAIDAALTESRSMRLELHVDRGARVDEVAAYWNAGPRRAGRNVEPMIRSILRARESDRRLDVMHLLPPLARSLLHTFADEWAETEGRMPDCHWSSLNFFRSQPEPFCLEERLASAVFGDSYLRVEPPYQFGDMIVFINTAMGAVRHSCVHIADDVVFTKNGLNALSPWVLQPLDHVKSLYMNGIADTLAVFREQG